MTAPFLAPTARTVPAAAALQPEQEPVKTAAELTGDVEWYLLELQDQPTSALAPYVDDLTEARDLLRNIADHLADQQAAS